MVPVQAPDAGEVIPDPVRMFVEVKMNVSVMADVIRDSNGDLTVTSVYWVQDPTASEVEEAVYNDPEAVQQLETRYREIERVHGKNPSS